MIRFSFVFPVYHIASFQTNPLPLVEAEATEGKRLWLGIDASSIARPESKTARDRTVVYQSNVPQGSKPITYGWQFSALVVLPEQPSSWVRLLDQQRIESAQTALEVAGQQLQRLLPLLSSRPILVGDRAYSAIRFLTQVAELNCDLLVRAKRNQVFYRPAPTPTGKRGAPRKDGDRFQCCDASTHGQADEQWQGVDEHGQVVEVSRWRRLHVRQARSVQMTLIRIIRHGATERKRDPKESWFIWIGKQDLPLCEIWSGYKRRYSQEHGYRFLKQSLMWAQPRLRTPEQFERWTDVVSIVHNQLVLARSQVQAQIRPWESQKREPTPQQVRRAMPRIVALLGTPAKPPKPRGKSAGRPSGATVTPAPRYEVVRKPKPVPKKPRQLA